MSIENHPNFHAVKFTTDILHSFQGCLRGNANFARISDERIRDALFAFVDTMENLAEESADKYINDSDERS
jgi:hypothetical protein